MPRLRRFASGGAADSEDSASIDPPVINHYPELPEGYLRCKDTKFTIERAMPWDMAVRGVYFYVDPAEMNGKELLPAVRAGKFVIFHGHRTSGKTTRMLAACKQLSRQFYVMKVSLRYVRTDSSEAFWGHLGWHPRRARPHLPRIGNADEFIRVFDAANRKALFEGKRVVLFVDDFDALEHAAPDVQREMLHALRELKYNRGKRCLHSVVVVGPSFSTLHLNKLRGRLRFDVDEAVATERFSEAQVEDLFAQLRSRGIRVDERIPVDVHRRTDGHPGLVGFCGKMMHEELARGTARVDMRQWEAWVATDLHHAIRYFNTFERMVTTVVLPYHRFEDAARWWPDARWVQDARRLLLGHILPHSGWVTVPDYARSLAEYMVTDGTLRGNPAAEGEYAIRSDLVRAALLTRVLVGSSLSHL